MNKFEFISEAQYVVDFTGVVNPVPHSDLKLPKRATKCSAGYDIYSPIDFILKPGETIKIPTGVRVLLDENKFLMIVPRIGLGFKYRSQLDNTVGVIDADYSNSDNEGHIWIKITNDSNPNETADKTMFISKGQGIAQGIILSYGLTDDDDTNGIRNGGFGSTTH